MKLDRTLANDIKILQCLAEKRCKIYGGVVRNELGQIKKHLVEVGQPDNNFLVKQLNQVLSQSNEQSKTLQKIFNLQQGQQLQLEKITSLLSLNLQVGLLTLGVVAVSFAIINQKINKINKKLDLIIDKLTAIDDTVKIIKELTLFAELEAALSEDLSNIKDFENKKAYLNQVRSLFSIAKAKIKIVIENIHSNYDSFHPETLLYPLKYFMLASVGYANTWNEINEIQQGKNSLKLDAEFILFYYKVLMNAQNIIGDTKTELLNLNEDIWKLSHYQEQLTYLDKNEISFIDWKKEINSKEKGVYLIDLQ